MLGSSLTMHPRDARQRPPEQALHPTPVPLVTEAGGLTIASQRRPVGPGGGARGPGSLLQVPLTLLLDVEQPVQQDQCLHQRGQQQSQAEESHHPVLLGLLGSEGSRIQGQLGIQPHALQSAPHVPVGQPHAFSLDWGTFPPPPKWPFLMPFQHHLICCPNLHFKCFSGCELSVQQQIDPQMYFSQIGPIIQPYS